MADATTSAVAALDLTYLTTLRDAAVEAAHKAGELMRQHAGRVDVDRTKAGHQDLVTLVDSQCQAIIEGMIHERFPGHKTLGEESVPPGTEASIAAIKELEQSEWLWVIDPIDGTTNFVNGLNASVVSIGIAYKGAVVVGVVHDPYRNETFAAIKGQGAWLNGSQRLRVSNQSDLKDALWSYGLGNKHAVAVKMIAGLTALIERSRGARSLGSAAMHLAYVAAGRFEGFWELNLSAWDVAAGSLLVTEAGGRVCDTRGAPYSLLTRDMYATCGTHAIHEGGLELMRHVGGDSV